jgi:hypothetical protein
LTQYRLGEYLVGVLAGYLMHHWKAKTLSKPLIAFGWISSIVFLLFHFVFSRELLSGTDRCYSYVAVNQVAWAASISWIIFACHHLKSGWIIQWILSLDFWQPLSKLCFGFYVMHYIYIQENSTYYPKSLKQLIQISCGDVTASLVLAVAFYLAIEAPVGNLLGLFWNRNKKEVKFVNY